MLESKTKQNNPAQHAGCKNSEQNTRQKNPNRDKIAAEGKMTRRQQMAPNALNGAPRGCPYCSQPILPRHRSTSQRAKTPGSHSQTVKETPCWPPRESTAKNRPQTADRSARPPPGYLQRRHPASPPTPTEEHRRPPPTCPLWSRPSAL
jgi:hypothetical protein